MGEVHCSVDLTLLESSHAQISKIARYSIQYHFVSGPHKDRRTESESTARRNECARAAGACLPHRPAVTYAMAMGIDAAVAAINYCRLEFHPLVVQ